GANPVPAVVGVGELPGKSSYFVGNDPKKWRANVPTYAKVEYRDVYPGVNLVYYGNQRQLEYDFVVSPGADPKAITLEFDGGGGVDAFVAKVNPTGTGLVYFTSFGGNADDQGFGIAVDALGSAYVTGFTISTNFPTTPGAFQTTFGGGRSPGPTDAFVTKLSPDGSALVYSTYLGGNGDDYGLGITVDGFGFAYVAG